MRPPSANSTLRENAAAAWVLQKWLARARTAFAAGDTDIVSASAATRLTFTTFAATKNYDIAPCAARRGASEREIVVFAAALDLSLIHI